MGAKFQTQAERRPACPLIGSRRRDAPSLPQGLAAGRDTILVQVDSLIRRTEPVRIHHVAQHEEAAQFEVEELGLVDAALLVSLVDRRVLHRATLVERDGLAAVRHNRRGWDRGRAGAPAAPERETSKFE